MSHKEHCPGDRAKALGSIDLAWRFCLIQSVYFIAMDIHASTLLNKWKKYELKNLLKPGGLLLSKSSNKKQQIMTFCTSQPVSFLYSSAIPVSLCLCPPGNPPGRRLQDQDCVYLCLPVESQTGKISSSNTSKKQPSDTSN